MVGLLSSGLYFRAKIIAVTLSLRSKRFKNSIWIPYGLKVSLHETIFSETLLCNIVATLFRTVPTLFQHCNAVQELGVPRPVKAVSLVLGWQRVRVRLRNPEVLLALF